MNPFSKWLLRDATILTSSERAVHAQVIGGPGTGKSRLLESWIMQDIAAGRGVGVIDPHGDLFQNLLVRLSFRPDVWSRVVILDPCSHAWAMPFNPLEAVSGYSQERLALFLTDIIGKIWGLNTASAPRTVWLLSNAFLALANLNLTLLHLPRFLLDADYRAGLMPRLTNPGALSFFQYEYPQSAAAAHQWAAPVLNKIGPLIFDRDIRVLLGGKSRISFRQVMDRQLILLVNLPKGTIGEGASALMGAFVVAHIQKAALARANSNNRIPFYFYLDEFQNYTADNIRDILSESRKYALSLILAHQYLEQLTPDIRHAMLNTAGSIACFRVGHQDGALLAKDIFPSTDFPGRAHPPHLVIPYFGWLDSQPEMDGVNGWERQTQLLTGLHFREFWLKRRGIRLPSKQRTLDMYLPPVTDEVRQQVARLIATSGKMYGRSKSALECEIHMNKIAAYGSLDAATDPASRTVEEEFPFWGES